MSVGTACIGTTMISLERYPGLATTAGTGSSRPSCWPPCSISTAGLRIYTKARSWA